MSTLKPCPFCEAAPIYQAQFDPSPPYSSRVRLTCPQCRQSSVCSDWYDGNLGAVEAAWNKRFGDADGEALQQ